MGSDILRGLGITGDKSLFARIDEMKALHFMIDSMGGRSAINGFLSRFPIPRERSEGARYRLRYLDTIPLANEIFAQGIYEKALDRSVRTVVDLGCNVGLFLARLAEVTPPDQLRGLAIDADAAMMDETRFTIAVNRLDGVIPCHGLVSSPSSSSAGAGGADDAPAYEDFYTNGCSIISSRFPEDEPGQTKKNKWTKVRVARVDVEKVYRDRIGDVPCDLLKVDIEGSERDWFVAENPFLRRVKRVVIECHKWIVPVDDILGRLDAMGFQAPSYARDSVSLAVLIADRATGA